MRFTPIGRRAFVGLMSATFLTTAVHAQDDVLPDGPITIVVPFAAGGATDVVGRLVAAELGERIGHNVLVENVAGAGGTLGASRVAMAEPDGATLLMGTVATHAIQPAISVAAPYDPVADFTPISLLATVPNVLLVNNDVEAKTTAELVALLKANPDEYNYGSSGIGAPTHLSGELFKLKAGVQMEHIPYSGGGPAMTDLVGGQIPILFDVLTGAAGFIMSDSVRPLAVTTKERSPAFPDVPTVAESGVEGLGDYETYTWNAIFAPAGLPQPVVDLLSKELAAVLEDPETRAKLVELSANPVGSTPEELADLVKSENAKWSEVISSAGIVMQ